MRFTNSSYDRKCDLSIRLVKENTNMAENTTKLKNNKTLMEYEERMLMCLFLALLETDSYVDVPSDRDIEELFQPAGWSTRWCSGLLLD